MGTRGETGPKNISGYVGTSLEDKVTSDNGTQIWSVPVTGICVIEMSGASGPNGGNSTEDSVFWSLGGGTGGASPVSQGRFGGGAFGVKLGGGGGGYSSGGSCWELVDWCNRGRGVV